MRFFRLCAPSALCSLLLIAAAKSQSFPADVEQKRAQLRPFVLSAIECIAGAIPGNPQAVALARKKKWVDAALATKKYCDTSVGQMASAVEIAFGPGEGRRYLATTFRSELATNLQSRVVLPPMPSPPPAVRAAAPAQTRGATGETDTARRNLLTAANERQNACIGKTAGELVPYSNESAETLATVILERCSRHMSEQVDVLVASFGMPRAEVEMLVMGVANQTKQRILGDIVTLRAAAARAAAEREGQGFKPPADGARRATQSF